MRNYVWALIIGLLMVGSGCTPEYERQIDTAKNQVAPEMTSPSTTIKNLLTWQWKPLEGDEKFEKFGKLTFNYTDAYNVIPPDEPQLMSVIIVEKKNDSLHLPSLDIFQKKHLETRLKLIDNLKENKNITPDIVETSVPKEQLKVTIDGEEFQVWLYYKEGDTAGKNELHTIFNSIKKS